MSAALSALVAQLLASPVVKWTLAFVAVFAFGFVRGCEWKASRVAAAERVRVLRVDPGPRPVLFPRIRSILSAPLDAAAATLNALVASHRPAPLVPQPDPISTPSSDEAAATEQTAADAIEAIRQAATVPIGTKPPAASCGPSGCSTGNCSRRPAGGGYTYQRRGVFGRLFR